MENRPIKISNYRQDGAPQFISWFINPINIHYKPYISTINHSEPTFFGGLSPTYEAALAKSMSRPPAREVHFCL